MELTELQEVVKTLQAEGKKLVFTNGCFDLLHVGHVRYLSAARKIGDRLIVAVNSDQSVLTLKGPSRPIVPEAERLEVLSALSCIDYLILFSAKTPKQLIEALAPDILVKGADWAHKDIVGGNFVEQRGGKVVRIELVEGASTTSIIERIERRLRRKQGSPITESFPK